MKKTMKRLFTLVLALVLAMALAVPMFAADIQPYAEVYKLYRLRPSTHTSSALSASTGNASVSLSTYNTNSDNQKWMIGRYGPILKLYANATIGTGTQMVLTVSAVTYTVKLAGETGLPWGQSVDFHTVGQDLARVYFDGGCDRYLEANDSYTGVTAAKYSDGQDRQIWNLS